MTSSSLIWSLSANFSTQNSDSIWSYGSKPSTLLSGDFSKFTNSVLDTKGSGVVALFKADNTWDEDWLGVYYNTKATTTILVYGSNMTFSAHGVCMHPGVVDDDYSVVQFTAPVNGIYTIRATFLHVDDHVVETNTSTGAYVMHNDEILWEKILTGYISESFSDGIEINENDTIEFLLGIGVGGDYHMTNVNVDISAKEENPSTSTTTLRPITSSTKSSNSVTSKTTANSNPVVIKNNSGSPTKLYWIAGSVGLILLIIGGGLFFIYYLHRRKKKNRLLIPSYSQHE